MTKHVCKKSTTGVMIPIQCCDCGFMCAYFSIPVKSFMLLELGSSPSNVKLHVQTTSARRRNTFNSRTFTFKGLLNKESSQFQ
eukprot:4976942-Amphidinium_carterae.1